MRVILNITLDFSSFKDTIFSELECTSFPSYYFLLPLWEMAFKKENDN